MSGGGNKWAELDLYLRHSRLRAPVLELFYSDQFRLAIAQRVARKSKNPPPETLQDLVAGALAARDLNRAISLLESKLDRGLSDLNDLLLLTYLYCLNGSVEKAESFAAANAGSIEKDWFVDWLWKKLQDDFGFRPPP